MSRYTGPVCRLCRAEGTKLFLKGDRCYTEKCAIARRNNKPGQHGARRGKESEYGLRLREKQKLRRFYCMNESQFRRFYTMATKMPGQTGHNFLQLLERRLDNVVYRMGLGVSRRQARQIVRHGHVLVNGRKVDIPSYLVKAGDKIEISEKSRDLMVIKENAEAASVRTLPAWLEFDVERMEGRVVSLPTRDQIEVPVTEQLVVEFYAR
ncbi:SSU ribosomal protein S4P [Thermovirga lienii DSM 17291]|uniref:Small ribosomal subunit protein uS4 n=1 Tax=Thermovirga lienii (strain ATCC BAA-1197 / DSM 17291 / Cas60314) TaxID=580340 RepID=G7V8W8_THELD|nr:30S ribosomal protein S4 [Thermovirga lienii]AER66409.1 SSU ribosomal protein S4P [Thermovirga lienii DSM 17291]MDN5318950.1 small subunit ribosomal protein [Thermovirga sp.]MDN5368601.1 small subunit ribosomal protein [Thermovirga sp.]